MVPGKRIMALIDPDNKVIESDETNNQIPYEQNVQN
jgi:hypothetical protein